MLTYDLKHQTAVVTGATSGIGLSAAIALASAGAQVIGVGRDAARCKAAEAAVTSACPGARVSYLLADLSLQSQVRRLAGDIHQALSASGIDHLDILVNDAGVYSESYVRTAEGIELTLAINHLAPFLLTHELMPLLLAAPDARVITVSSDSHYNAHLNLRRLNAPFIYIGVWAYMVSKLANVLFTLELNRRFSGITARAFAVDPGLVNTDIGLKRPSVISGLLWKLRSRQAGVPPEVPARTILFLAGEPSLPAARDSYWYDCRLRVPSRAARNAQTALSLWEKSRQLCGITDQP